MFDLQKASMIKRVSAWLLDTILVLVLVTGFALLLSAILNYDSYNDELQQYYTDYERKYNISFSISEEEYLALGENDMQRYDAAYAALESDTGIDRAFSMVVQLSLIILSFSVLLAITVMDFALPLIFKNGQTLGKKIFGIAVMGKGAIRVKPLTLLIRTLLGKYTIETMVPLLIIFLILFGSLGSLGLILLAALLLFQIVLMAATSTNSAIHDALAQTVCVDMESQMIFDSIEERDKRREEYEHGQSELWGR